MTESKWFQLRTVGTLSLLVVSSVSIVICNKALITTLGFNFGVEWWSQQFGKSLPFLSWVLAINVGKLFGHVRKMQTWADLKIVKAVMRIQFPDNCTLEGTFYPSETIQSLNDLKRQSHTCKAFGVSLLVAGQPYQVELTQNG